MFSMEGFNASCHFEHDYAVVTCTGEIDMATVGRFMDVLNEVRLGSPKRLRLDLSRISFVAAHGIDVVIEIRRWCQEEGVEFELLAVPQVERLLGMVDGIPAGDSPAPD